MTEKLNPLAQNAAPPPDANLMAAARQYMLNPWVLVVLCFGLGFLCLLETGRLIQERAPAIYRIDAMGLFTIAALGVFFLGLAFWLALEHYQPVDDEGIALLKAFPFNEGASEYLRCTVERRSTVRVADLREALHLHFEQGAEVDATERATRRDAAMARFKRTS